MGKIDDILKQNAHRPYELPHRSWAFYQQWNHVLFFHWSVDPELLQPMLPKNLDLDLFDGKAYVSLVPFSMQQIRPKFLPAFQPVSDFHEVNIRTYVIKDGKPGVYFFNLEAGKSLSAFISRQLSGMPYEKAKIERSQGKYVSSNAFRHFFLDIEFAIKEKCNDKTEIEKFLTERYAAYVDIKGKLFRYDIHHKEWEIKTVDIQKLHLDYRLPGLEFAKKQPDLIHYSDGVEVLAWPKVEV
ncbi:YqjF family protein [Flavobacterium sp.]|uniref:YqjF family protein n=1 Tax=Flavobacterium sp. TaxID=239 RepID=UPI0039E6D437